MSFFVNADPKILYTSLKGDIDDIESNLTTKFKDKYKPIEVSVEVGNIKVDK